MSRTRLALLANKRSKARSDNISGCGFPNCGPTHSWADNRMRAYVILRFRKTCILARGLPLDQFV